MKNLDLDRWCRVALESVLSLWNDASLGAWRNSHEKRDGKNENRPTVTYNAVVTFDEFGLFSTPLLGEKTPRIDSSVADQLIAKLTAAPDSIKNQLKASAHKQGARQLINLSNLFSALRCLVLRGAMMTDAHRDNLVIGIGDATETVLKLLEVSAARGGELSLAEKLADNPSLSSYLLLYARLLLLDRETILARLSKPSTSSKIDLLTAALGRYFEREVDRLMARRGVEGDTGFDAASLAFALRGRLTYEPPPFRESPFFASCVQAIIDGQNKDGTWPDGVSAMVDESAADTLQQPSVKTAFTLAQIVFEPRMLVRFGPSEMSVLEAALPALNRTARYLAATHVATENASGWVSDRVRWPETAETWITALAARFFLSYRLACRAVERAQILKNFSTRSFPASSVEERRSAWAKLSDPDSLLKPYTVVMNEFIEPILKQQEAGSVVVYPDANGVSFIIYGPPGSGKTYFMNMLATCVGWPLIELNPGNFVSDGAELIEAKAREIFDRLLALDHAIVFFDECDELFLTRDSQKEGAHRSILSFVTACMLPKLQNLHDKQNVIFVVATNYLRRIDRAIRRPGRFDQILLLDRPDNDARRILLDSLWSKRSVDPQLFAKRAKETGGLTTKEILDYAKKLGPDKEVPVGSRGDYVEWCKADATDELESSRATAEQRVQITKRWEDFTLPEWPDF